MERYSVQITSRPASALFPRVAAEHARVIPARAGATGHLAVSVPGRDGTESDRLERAMESAIAHGLSSPHGRAIGAGAGTGSRRGPGCALAYPAISSEPAGGVGAPADAAGSQGGCPVTGSMEQR